MYIYTKCTRIHIYMSIANLLFLFSDSVLFISSHRDECTTHDNLTHPPVPGHGTPISMLR